MDSTVAQKYSMYTFWCSSAREATERAQSLKSIFMPDSWKMFKRDVATHPQHFHSAPLHMTHMVRFISLVGVVETENAAINKALLVLTARGTDSINHTHFDEICVDELNTFVKKQM